MKFDDIRKAFNWLVNENFENLSAEQRKELRPHKSNFNHASISVEKMEELLSKYGKVTKNIEFELK